MFSSFALHNDCSLRGLGCDDRALRLAAAESLNKSIALLIAMVVRVGHLAAWQTCAGHS